MGELTPELQVKLLRALQEGEIDPVGAKRPVKTNFRLISATNRTMMDMVSRGRFREDLYYRLNVFPVTVPPLRARRGDIAALVRHFTARICLEEGRRQISGIRSDALAMLEAHDWPGNIRQLENALFRAIVLCDGDELTSLRNFRRSRQPRRRAQLAPPPWCPLGAGSARTEQPASTAAPSGEAFVAPPARPVEAGHGTYGMIAMVTERGDVARMDAVEETMIRFAIDHHDGRMTAVARSLGNRSIDALPQAQGAFHRSGRSPPVSTAG